MKHRFRRRGAALAVALCTLVVVTLIAGTVVRSLTIAHRQSRREQEELQAQWLAEAAVTRAKAQLARHPDYAGETWKPSIGIATESGTAEIQVKQEGSQLGHLKIVVLAQYPNHEWRRSSAQKEHTLLIPPTRAAPIEKDRVEKNTVEKAP